MTHDDKTAGSSWMAIAFAIALSGCAALHEKPTVQPLVLSRMMIYADREAGNGPDNIGTIHYPFCVDNKNNFTITANAQTEVYILGKTSNDSWKLVEQDKPAYGPVRARAQLVGFAASHTVFPNETAASGSTDYAIHLWTEITQPGNAQRWDRWWNISFTPIATPGVQEDFYTTGNSSDCEYV